MKRVTNIGIMPIAITGVGILLPGKTRIVADNVAEELDYQEDCRVERPHVVGFRADAEAALKGGENPDYAKEDL